MDTLFYCLTHNQPMGRIVRLLMALALLGNMQAAVAMDSVDWLGTAQSLERQGNWPALLRLGQDWAQAQSNTPLAWFVQGRAFSALGRYPEAISAYRQNLALDPRDSYAHNNLGNIYFNLRQYRSAMEAYHAAVRSEPGYLLAWRNLGQTYYLLKGPRGVAVAIQRLQASDPALARAWAQLAATYSVSRSPRVEQQAIQILRQLTPEQRERMFDILLADFQ